jgi:hypothetical protein
MLRNLEGGTQLNCAVTVDGNKGGNEFRRTHSISDAVTGQFHLFSCSSIEAS